MKKLLLLILSGTSIIATAETYVDANIGMNTSWNSVSLNANAGNMFSRYIGAEGGLTYSPGYSYNYNGGSSYSTSYYMIDAAAKGVLPLTSGFDLYGKLGLGFNNYTSSWNGCNGCGNPNYYGSNVGLLVGVGAEFKISRSWSLHAEDYTVTGPNPNMLMFGGQYNF